VTDRAFEPPEDNPFAQFGPKPLPDASLPKPEEDGDAANPFAQFGPKPQPEPVGAFGAFRRGAVRGVVPAATGLAAAAPAAEAGAVAGGFVAGPPGAFVGGIIGGVGGAIAGGMAGEAAQHWALSKLPESWVDALGMSDRQQKLDEEQAPKASFLGGLAPYAITMRPGGFARKTLPENSTALERIMAHPATARVFGGGIMGGMELGQEAAQGESPNWTKVAISTGFGLVFNKPTRIGEIIGEIGAHPVRRALGVPEPLKAPSPLGTEEGAPAPVAEPKATEAPPAAPRPAGIAPTLFHAEARPAPTIADAADLNVAGPGVTETVFLGSHERDPVATEASRETKRTEQSVIGPGPAPPDVHSVARQMHFDLFSEYDALRDRRRALEAEPGAADHLAATEARLAELEKDVQAANRRAAEATGQPLHEPPVEAPPIAPDIETQKAAIAADVSQQLRAAGRPLDEAEAAGKLIAARYAARAGAFKGALGTAEELYRREGAEIRAMEIRRKVRTPASARALDDFQQRMAAGKEAAQRRRNEGGSAVRIMTTAEKYAGVTEEEFNAAQREAEEAAPELKTLLRPDDWDFIAERAEKGEFFQRKRPSEPDLFTQREAEGQMRMPGPLHVVTKATEEGRPIVLGAHRTPESATTHQESLFKSAWDKEQRENFEPEGREEYPGREAFLESQKNAAREFSYPHEIPQIHEIEAALDNEAHVVATGIPDEVGIKIHGAFATAEEATAAADKVARDQWENGHGKPVESDRNLWDKGLRKAVNDWNKAHGTDIDPEVVSYHSDIGWYAESLNDDLQAHRDPVDPELNRQLQAVGDAMAPYPGLKKAAAYWREQGDADYLIPTIAKMKVEGDRLAQRKSDEPLKPGVAQKPMDIGLFSDEAKQRELFQPNFTAYHGSPYDFDRFDVTKIGTGEGAQAYGHGLYFAENEGVAKGYQANVKDTALIDRNNKRMSELAKDMEANSYGYRHWKDKELGERQAAEYDRLMEEKMRPGRMYQVRIKPDSEHFLDWDGRLSQMPPKVQEAVRSLQIPDPLGGGNLGEPGHVMATGEEIWKALARKAVPAADQRAGFEARNPTNASETLRAVGVPGIRYLDQGSRNHAMMKPEPHEFNDGSKGWVVNGPKGDEFFDTKSEAHAFIDKHDKGATRNYVVFDDKDVEVTHKDGTPVTPVEKKEAIEAHQQEFRQKALGSFMPPQAGARSLIKLAKDANASTFMHESGHDFLEQMMRDDAHPLAPADLKADAKTVRDWLGIETHQDLNTGWPGERGRAARRAHEKFARGFEQYLREGHAPSTELKAVFERFRQWLWHIYDTVKKAYEQLGEPISDDIKRVFDRMLSTEPQRTVIAPERDLPRSLADIHEADAAFYADHEMEGVGDRIAAEHDRAYAENPHAPSLETKVTDAEAAEPSGEARPHEPQGGEVHPGGGAAEPDAGRGGPGGVDETQLTGGAEGLSEGAGARGTEPESGRERSESVPLAGRPAENLTVGGQSFNVGKDGNVRAENITSVPQFIEAINESSDRIATGNDNILTMGQMKGIADDFGLDAKTIDETRLAGMFGGLHNIAAKIRAFRETVLTQSKTVHGLMQAVKETNSDQAVAEFAKEAARLDMMMSVLSSVTTEMGRGLGMGFKNLEGWKQAKDLNEFLKANTGKELFQLKMIAKLGSQLDSPAKVARFLRDAQNRSFGGMVLEYWINGLISGIATHSTYAVGNSILTAEKLGPETAAAAMIGAARKAMGREGETVRFGEVGAHFAGAVRGLPASLQAAAEGLRTGLTTLLPGESARPLIPFTGDTGLVTARTIGNEPVSWGELGADLFGMVRGLRDGIVSGAALIKAGGEAGAPAVGFSYSPLGQIPDIAIRGVPAIPLGSAIRVPGRFIAAIHSFFRTTNYSAYRAGGAYRTAIEAGERAKAEGRAFSGSDFDAETANAWLNPSEAQMEKYRLEATETALMGHAGKFTENLQRLTNTEVNLPVIGGVRLLKFVDPFVHISSNIIKQTVLQRTPLGLLSSELRADLSGANGNIAQDTAMARMLVGSALSLTFGGLAAQGYITGSGPKDPHEAAMWREVYQPHSVRVGDMWYQVNRLGPMGMLLGIAADLYEVAHDATEGDLLKAAAHLQHAFTQNILDESFMRGPADLIKAVEDPGRYGEGYIKNFASSFVPFSVGMAQMARAADPYSRQARNVMDAIRAKVPGYSQELLPRRNIWGDEIPNLPALGGRAISALYEKQVNSDPVNQAMVDLGVHPAMPERKIRNIELTDQQYDDFTRIAGRMAKQRLDIIVRSPDWQTWPNHSRHDVIAEVVRQSREAARGMVMMKYPKIPRDAAEALRKKKTGEK
jgi:hypothetical protein